jgi:hypothetical protein
VEDDLNARAGSGAGGWIGEVPFHEFHRLKANQIGACAGNKIVDAANCLTARQKRSGKGAANKTGCSSDKIFRQTILPKTWAAQMDTE